MRPAWLLLLACWPMAGLAAAPDKSPIAERSISDLDAMLASGRTTSRALVKAYLSRIGSIDRTGPALNSVILVNPDALAQAGALDEERRAGHIRGPLHGIPVLIKDNIETKDRMPTTAGSLALKDNISGRDAPLVARLREAGAVILGKTNLSEWANIRSTRSSSGWSAVGGLTKNPYALNRNACGSSSGSGAAAAASLAAAAVGTETDGSITCPAAVNGIVGFKPTVGLVSRTHVIPISHSQDTAGPMTREVRDAALLLTVMAGSDPADPATAEADQHLTDFAAGLTADALRGKRIGVLRFAVGPSPETVRLFDAALKDLQAAGAVLVEIDSMEGRPQIREAEQTVLTTELKANLDRYLASTDPGKVRTRSLEDIIAFNRANASTELRWFGQERFETSVATRGLQDADYLRARTAAKRIAGPEGIDQMLEAHRLDALVAPTTGPSWTTDLVNGDHVGGGGAGSLAAVAGYPHLTVPMGYVHGLPVGFSFIGPAWADAQILALGYAYEQRTKHRQPPSFAHKVN